MPNIVGEQRIALIAGGTSSANGFISLTSYGGQATVDRTASSGLLYQFDASRVNNKYKNSLDEVCPDNFAVRFCYRAF